MMYYTSLALNRILPH